MIERYRQIDKHTDKTTERYRHTDRTLERYRQRKTDKHTDSRAIQRYRQRKTETKATTTQYTLV